MSNANREPELQGASIVSLGRFNPPIFQPFWFSRNNLIREEEAESASVEIIHKDVAVFSIEWFSVQVTGEEFSVETTDPTKYEPLRDLAIGTFKILEHSPIGAFGFNSNEHYAMKDEAEWHAFGDHYAPKESWQSVLKTPGMTSLTIQGERDACDANRIQVRIEPSQKVSHGVYIHVNQHYDVADNEKEDVEPAGQMTRFLETLQDSWGDFLTYSARVAAELLNACENG